MTAAAGGSGDPRSDGYQGLYIGLVLVAAALCLLRGVLIRDRQQLVWLTLAAGMVCYAAGYGEYFDGMRAREVPGLPAVSDGLWLSYYVASVGGLLALLHGARVEFRRSLWLDAAVGALAITTIGAAVLVDPLLESAGASYAAVATNLAYPLLDVLILSLLLCGFVVSNWRPGRVWTLLAVVWSSQTIGDIAYLHQAAGGTYEFGTPLDGLWPALMLLVAVAAWQKSTVTQGAWVRGWGALVVTIAFATVGLFVLAYDHWHDIPDVAIVLATLTLVAGFVRTAMAFGDMRTLAHGRELLLRNELILNSAGEGIFGIDSSGAVTFANPAAVRMTQYASDELTGQFLHGLVHHTKADGTPYPAQECPLVAAMQEGTSRRDAEDVIWRKDGTSFPVEYTSMPIVDGAHTGGAVLVFRDVTERREIERVKDQFTSLVSHELRTPLTAIRGSLGLLESGVLGPLPGRSQRMIEIAVQNTDRLVRMINDILDLERIDSEAIHLRLALCDAEQLIARATEAMSPVAAVAGVTIVVDAEPARLVVDADLLIQTLTNLISNAATFSPAGATVRVTAQRRGDEVLFAVSDDGRGIPPDKLESIFGRFQQVDASDSREKGGTGLGLAICRSIVEHHGGRIWADSVPGVGSTFSLVVPSGLDDDDAYEPGAAAGRGPAVLVCDDDAGILEVMGTALQERGYHVIPARSGEVAVQRARSERPAAILLDLVMAGMSGWEVASALQQHPDTARIPIVVLSVLPRPARELPLGAVMEWLEKPADGAAVFAALERAIAARDDCDLLATASLGAPPSLLAPDPGR
jgi:PAS domain S-box-containing protein